MTGLSELEKLQRQADYDKYRRDLMAKRNRVRREAEDRGEEVTWHYDPPIAVPDSWGKQDGAVTLHDVTPISSEQYETQRVPGLDNLGRQIVDPDEPRLLTVEEQFRRSREKRWHENIKARLDALVEGQRHG